MPVNPQTEFDLVFDGESVPPEEQSQQPAGSDLAGLPPDFLNAVQELQKQYGNVPLEAEIVPAEGAPATEAPAQEAPVEGTAPTEVPQEGQPPVEDWEQKYKSFQGSANAQLQQAMEREKAYQEEIAKLQSMLQQQGQPTTEETTEATAGGEQSPSSLPVEEDPEVKEFMETYPEIARPLTKLLTASLDKAVKNILGEVEKREKSLREMVDPLKDEIGYLNKAHHLDQILRVHPDAVDIANSGELEKWINTQPPEVQAQLNTIVDKGTPEQVVSVLDAFKRSRQSQAQQPAQPQQGLPAQGSPTEVPLQETQAPQLSPEDAQKLSMIEAVKRKGATQPKTSKAVDFDTAFEEAVRGLTNL